jgi:hypothetical protein
MNDRSNAAIIRADFEVFRRNILVLLRTKPTALIGHEIGANHPHRNMKEWDGLKRKWKERS